MLKASHSQKCLTISGSNNGANVEQSSCTGAENQMFNLISTNGAFQVKAVHSGKCLAVQGGSNKRKNGQNIEQRPCNTKNIRLFTTLDKGMANGNALVSLKNKMSNKCIDIAGVSVAEGANAQQWSCNNNDNQIFELAPQDNSGSNNKLVLHYDFENDIDILVFDQSESSADGVVIGQKESVSGVIGQAIKLDPQSANDKRCLDVGDPAPLSFPTYTLMAWVNMATIDSYDGKRMEVLEKTDSYWLNVRDVDNKNINGWPVARCGSFFNEPGENNAVWYYADTPFGLEDNRWYHLACTFDGSEFQLYVDGIPVGVDLFRKNQPVSSVTAGATVVQNNLPLAVGCKDDVNSGQYVAQWQGLLDEVRIYNHSLTADQIFELFNQ